MPPISPPHKKSMTKKKRDNGKTCEALMCPPYKPPAHGSVDICESVQASVVKRLSKIKNNKSLPRTGPQTFASQCRPV